jgi:hypothetical protein
MDAKAYGEMLAFQSLSDREFIRKLRESASQTIQLASEGRKLITDSQLMLAKFKEHDPGFARSSAQSEEKSN